MSTIVFTGGGTGGHIYPGLAIADELHILSAQKNQSMTVYWIGNAKGMDRHIVESFTGTYTGDGNTKVIERFYGIPSGKLRRYLSLQNFVDVFKIIAGCIAAFFILLKLKPAVLFSKGGFVSVPPCLAARLLHIPVYTHECDFTPGLATRINARSATKLLVSYKETIEYLHGGLKERAVVTGNPVRPVFYHADPAIGRRFLGLDGTSSKPVLMVVGGSLGARQINKLVADNLDWLCEHFIVVHQTGKNTVDNGSEGRPIPADYKPYQFIYGEMPHVLACADVILGRAGANSLWECAVLGKPMVLIPLCGSGTRGDQVDNAAFFACHDAALSLEGDDATSDNMKEALSVFFDADKRRAYGDAARQLAGTEPPAEKIALLLLAACGV
ncbi:MAG: UDP-N-acetylglucosamine--N-acetylmuramyl-(pentapeptide) pyrophosphoryl-undecaprenol N-acetylglucosamine transferase [Treponema sp.]|nr:UDP-N-acetylglucosamine--N-acetylmuramyl-(pentapeptide) pyrophosphoryl-undecaprenol N-acetylglucosamine transferase [Treponema sp.]